MRQAELPLSSLGFGVSGPHASPAVSRAHTHCLIQDAIDLGITCFDTAPLYGQGEAEKRLGAGIENADRSKLVIMTKAGVPRRNARDFSPDGITSSIEGSLRRLGTDYLDILLLQGVAIHELNDALLTRLDSHVSAGRVRHIGICGRGDELDAPLELDLISVVMAPAFHGMTPTALERLKRAHSNGKTVIGIESMAGARQSHALPRTPADLWYFARRLKRGRIQAGSLSHTQALQWSLDQTFVDCTLSLTTRLSNLRTNARLAGLDDSPHAT